MMIKDTDQEIRDLAQQLARDNVMKTLAALPASTEDPAWKTATAVIGRTLEEVNRTLLYGCLAGLLVRHPTNPALVRLA